MLADNLNILVFRIDKARCIDFDMNTHHFHGMLPLFWNTVYSGKLEETIFSFINRNFTYSFFS